MFRSRGFLAITALLALSACGRRGDLEPPTAAIASPAPQSRESLDVHRPNTKIVPPKRDFVLDPMLQ